MQLERFGAAQGARERPDRRRPGHHGGLEVERALLHKRPKSVPLLGQHRLVGGDDALARAERPQHQFRRRVGAAQQLDNHVALVQDGVGVGREGGGGDAARASFGGVADQDAADVGLETRVAEEFTKSGPDGSGPEQADGRAFGGARACHRGENITGRGGSA